MEVIFKRRLHKAVGGENSRHREPGLRVRAELGNPKEKMYYPEMGDIFLKILLVSRVPNIKNKVVNLRVNMWFSDNGHLILSCFEQEGKLVGVCSWDVSEGQYFRQRCIWGLK